MDNRLNMTKNDTFIKLVLNRVFNNYIYYDNINIISNHVLNILNRDLTNKYNKLLTNKLAYYVYFNDLSYLNNTLKDNIKILLNNKYDKLLLNYYKNDNDNDKLIKKYNTQTKLKKLYNNYIVNEFTKLLNNRRSYKYNNIFKLEFNIERYYEFNDIDIYIYINTKYFYNNNNFYKDDLDNDIKHDREYYMHDFRHIKIVSHDFNNYLTSILFNELFIKDNNKSVDDKMINYFNTYIHSHYTPNPNQVLKKLN